MRKLLATLTLSLCLPLSAFAENAYETQTGCSHPFLDSKDHAYAEEICFLYTQGVVEGYSQRSFAPEQNLTRAEFLKIALLNLGYSVTPVQSQSFSDTPSGDWYFRYVTFARSKGWIQGYADGSFRPNNSITRAEAITMTMNIAGIQAPYPLDLNAFDDIDSTAWYAQSVAAAAQYDIIDIFEPYFDPHSPIRRGEMAVIAARTWEVLF
jgi:hypothetical protein